MLLKDCQIDAARTGINWALALTMDISRDPRWGRIAESFREDVFFTCGLAVYCPKARGFTVLQHA